MSEEKSSKIRIKMGMIELEYEGSESFLKKELPDLLSAVSTLYRDSGGAVAHIPPQVDPVAPSVTAPTTNQNANKIQQGTTGAIAAKLNCSSGRDLVLSAAAKLTFVDGVETMSRQKLLDTMKEAKSYYRSTYSGNLTATLSRLIKTGALNEPSNEVYALTAQSITELRQALDS